MNALFTDRGWLIGIPVLYTAITSFLVNLLTGEIQLKGTTNWASLFTNRIAWLIILLAMLFVVHQLIADKNREQLNKRTEEAETSLILLQRSVPAMTKHLIDQIESGNLSGAVDAAEAFKKIREHLS